MAERCWLHGYGPCGGKLNGEHYIPKSTLRLLAAGNSAASIGGFKWQPKGEIQRLGLKALTTKLYCEKHNSGLSPLDNSFKQLLCAIIEMDKSPQKAKRLTCLEGPVVERALLKILVGTFAVQEGRNNLPEDWKGLLAGTEIWPDGWGLYVAIPPEPEIQIVDGHLAIQAHLNPTTGKPISASFYLGGILVRILVEAPQDPTALGMHRPNRIVFERDNEEFGVKMAWPHEPNGFVVFSRTGSTNAIAPTSRGWKRPR